MSDHARHHSPYAPREKIARLLWAITQATAFRCSFHTMNGWRAFLLRRFGARVGTPCMIRRTVRIECPWNLTIGNSAAIGDRAILYALGHITIGDRVTISQHAHLCAGTHDFDHPDMPLIRPPITIERDAWIAADAFVGPNVTVHEGAILGARACAFSELEAWTIYGGNPARAIKPRSRPEKD
jgi:putative colanic acid biosynthesis acetyltransferase WcaF